METEKREVNLNETEVINADAISDGDEPELDEEVIPPVDESEASKTEPEGTKEPKTEEAIVEPSASSPDEAKESEAKAKEPEPSQPKPVEGETARERAYRKEIEHLREERRKDRNQKIVSSIPPQQAKEDEEYTKLKETYNEQELSNLEKLVDVVARKKGYVRQEQSYQQMANSTLEDFTSEHTEYLQQNDPDDARWGMFQRILASDYNLANKTQKQLKVIFLKVHRDVKAELGEEKPKSDPGKVEAQRQKIQSVSHSGGTKVESTPKTASIDPSVRGLFKGFDDSDFN